MLLCTTSPARFFEKVIQAVPILVAQRPRGLYRLEDIHCNGQIDVVDGRDDDFRATGLFECMQNNRRTRLFSVKRIRGDGTTPLSF